MSDRLLYQSEAEQLVLERGLVVAEPEVLFSIFVGASGIQGSFDSANFEMSKVYKGNVDSLCRLAQFFLDTLAVILRKKREIVR